MSIFVLKIIACFTMILDHLKYCNPIFRNNVTIYVGRISFPLFAFILSEGYIHTKDLKKYYMRLFIFALISQIPFMLFRHLVGEWKMLNILFTLLLGLLSITVYEKVNNKFLSIPVCGLIIYLSSLMRVDYGWFGVTLTLLFYVCKKDKLLLASLYFSLISFYFYKNEISILDNKTYFIFHMIPLIFILMYNGKKGKSMKYFFYFFYPVHMMIIYLIHFIK